MFGIKYERPLKANEIRVGREVATLDFTDVGVKATLKGHSAEVTGTSAVDIISAVGQARASYIASEQAQIQRMRDIEDARRAFMG